MKKEVDNIWVPQHGITVQFVIAIVISILVTLLFVWSLRVFAQDIAPPVAPTATVADNGFDVMSLVLQILPLFLATLSPFLTQGIRSLVKTASSSVSPKVWGAITMVLGSVIPAIAAALTDGSVEVAAAGGAAISGVSWNLKQGAPVIAKTEV